MEVTDSLLNVSGIGPSTYLKLQKVGLSTVLDLIQSYPIRYEDFSETCAIAFAQPDDAITIKAVVKSINNQFTRKKNFNIQKVTVADNSGEIEVIWFNQPFILRAFKKNSEYYFSGKVTVFNGKLGFAANEYDEVKNTKSIHTGRIVPYYSSTLGVSNKVIRAKIHNILVLLDNKELKNDLIQKFSPRSLLSVTETLNNLHFPTNSKLLEQAQYRLKYEFLTVLKLSQSKNLKISSSRKSPETTISPTQFNKFTKALPFTLTKSQQQVCAEIERDFKTGKMNRILMGDVGSGKTVIMCYSALLMSQHNYQTLVMAPTEVLALQHFDSFQKLLKFGQLKIGLLTAKNKLTDLASYDIIIGTQALIFSKLSFGKLGLVIVDEQHKFGVRQRETLLSTQETMPYFLTVSATPIPRSLALTLYGDLDISYLTEKPNNALSKTYLVPEFKREKAFIWIKNKVKTEKTQVYVVCAAAVEKNKKETELKTVENEEQKLKQLLPDLSVKGIYSKHPRKNEILSLFRDHKLDALASTSLIEVGLDISNANIMVVENSDRFGLSQLHQLRGRIGRRDQPAFCFLFTDSQNPSVLSRLKILTQTNDGLDIATKDLKLRGPGDFLGTEQHGFDLLSTQDLLNSSLIDSVKETVKIILDNFPSVDYTSILVRY